jgi:hypothetical protein
MRLPLFYWVGSDWGYSFGWNRSEILKEWMESRLNWVGWENSH